MAAAPSAASPQGNVSPGSVATVDAVGSAPGPAPRVPGLSSVSIENSTEYHILCFYKGAENVAVVCNPYRKGALPLKNGRYEIAVITTSRDIIPYHGEDALADQCKKSIYKIVYEGREQPGQNMLGGGSSAVGPYELLRRRADHASLSVDPATGEMVSR